MSIEDFLLIAGLIIYVILGLISFWVNNPTIGKVLAKFLFLAGMMFIGGLVAAILTDMYGSIGGTLSLIFILGVSLWSAFKW